jgi:hypothetical protein
MFLKRSGIMEGVREYLLSVTTGAMLCGILYSLIGEKGSISGLFRLIGGLFLCFLVIAPFARVELKDFTRIPQDILFDARNAARQGEKERQESLRQIITDETRSYIMDKARSYGAEIQVKITLSQEDPPVPNWCTITGKISPFVKQQLQKVLTNELMIPEENQRWIP